MDKIKKYELCAHSSADRVPGYEPVGRRFKSCWARHNENHLVHYGTGWFLIDKYMLLRLQRDNGHPGIAFAVIANTE